MNLPSSSLGTYSSGFLNNAVTQPKAPAQQMYTLSNGTTSPYDPSNNYDNSGMSQTSYYSMYGDPNQQGAAAEAASKAADTAGNNAANNKTVNPTLPGYTGPTPGPGWVQNADGSWAPPGGANDGTATGGGKPMQPGVLSGPGYGENWYQMYGDSINQPTNTQKLFDQGPGAGNPLYDSMIDMTNRKINSETAARGIYDGSAALGSIGLADADIRAQQAKDYSSLGAAADQATQGAYTAGSSAANNAENQTNQRVQSIVGGQTNLSKAQSDSIQGFYDMAEKGQLTGDMASIEAQIQASGVDAATAQAITSDLLQIGGIAAKAGAGGK